MFGTGVLTVTGVVLSVTLPSSAYCADVVDSVLLVDVVVVSGVKTSY